MQCVAFVSHLVYDSFKQLAIKKKFKLRVLFFNSTWCPARAVENGNLKPEQTVLFSFFSSPFWTGCLGTKSNIQKLHLEMTEQESTRDTCPGNECVNAWHLLNSPCLIGPMM